METPNPHIPANIAALLEKHRPRPDSADTGTTHDGARTFRVLGPPMPVHSVPHSVSAGAFTRCAVHTDLFALGTEAKRPTVYEPGRLYPLFLSATGPCPNTWIMPSALSVVRHLLTYGTLYAHTPRTLAMEHPTSELWVYMPGDSTKDWGRVHAFSSPGQMAGCAHVRPVELLSVAETARIVQVPHTNRVMMARAAAIRAGIQLDAALESGVPSIIGRAQQQLAVASKALEALLEIGSDRFAAWQAVAGV